MSNVIALHNRGWMEAGELAGALGISTRTVYRRVNRGEVEARETAEGMRYRLTPTESPCETDRHDTPGDPPPVTLNPLEGRGESRCDTPPVMMRHDRHDTPAVTTLAELLAGEAVARGRAEAERDALAVELERWKAFALEAVEEVERLRGY